jgi:hypothetical protein
MSAILKAAALGESSIDFGVRRPVAALLEDEQ